MKKISNQIIYNLKKEKASFLSFGIIIMITALILNSAAVLLRQMERAYDDKFNNLNTAKLNILVSEIQSKHTLKNEIEANENIEKVECHMAVFTEVTVKDFNGADFAMNTVFYNIEDERTLNNYEIVSECENIVENPIYIPRYVSDFGGFELNEKIVYVIDGKYHSFTVAGVIEEMQYGNYGSGLLCAYLPEEEYVQMSNMYSNKAVVEYSMRVKNCVSIDAVKEALNKVIENNGVNALSILDNESVKGARTMVADLLVLIMTAFALIILVVSVFLSNFKVKNSIETEVTNMSILKALGYTSAQIVASITLSYGITTLLFGILGASFSYMLLPMLCSLLTVQSGFSFDITFDVASFIGIICILSGVVIFFTFIVARKIKKTQPIDGLRGTIGSKHIKRNYFPLDKNNGNIKILLVLKEMFILKKQNIMIFLVSFVLTILIAFSGTLFYNVVVKPENFMSALSEEMPDVVIYPRNDNVAELEDEIEQNNRVEYALKYMVSTVKIENKVVNTLACEDFSKVRNDICYKGKNPKEADEIALGSVFDGKYKIGDTVNVTAGNITKCFRITGFVQSVNMQGELCELGLDGYNTLFMENQQFSIYLYLVNREDAEETTEKYKADYPECVTDVVNFYRLQKEAQDMYMGITVILVVAIFVVTILIVIFILYIVIKSLLVKRKQELGIYKAMGYTSSQLILQSISTFLPVTMLAIVISSILALFYMPPIYQLIFEALGVMKNSIEISFGYLMLFAVVQILANIVISIILCMPIRKISAYILIRE